MGVLYQYYLIYKIMEIEIVQRMATRAFIIHEGKVLIIREAPSYKYATNIGKYDFPGGKVRLGETMAEGLKREVKEESGLDVKVGKPFYADEWSPVRDGVTIQIFGVFIKCTIDDPEVVLDKDHDDYKWIDPADYAEYPIISQNLEAFKAYLSIQ
jgi:8-oxo-dGTP diphosphatase